MLWQEEVATVVMLTNLIEEGKKKCAIYWPKQCGQSMVYGQVEVRWVDETKFADYVVRRLEVKLLQSSSSTPPRARMVTMFHFTSWPDKGVPEAPNIMTTFVGAVKRHVARSNASSTSHAVTVHCSAGVGRTGTFIALWNLLDEAASTGYLDIITAVRRLRNSRFKMVQTAMF